MMTPTDTNGARTDERSDDLEQRLADATDYTGPETQLWKQALERCAPPEPLPFHARIRAFLTPARLGIAACIGLLITGAIFLTNPPVETGRVALEAETTQGEQLHDRMAGLSAMEPAPPAPGAGAPSLARKPPADAGEQVTHAEAGKELARMRSPQPATGGDRRIENKPAARAIITRVDLELEVDDVNLAFQRISRLIDEHRSEYIAESSLTGADKTPVGRVRLRVVASRLGEVLAACREFGTVASERTSSDDVTDQVVDLEARLANETATEKELRELLAERADAKLPEIMEVRESLKRVRAEIERLTAQHDRLRDLTQLATIDILIVNGGAEPEPEPDEGSFGALIGEELGAAWADARLTLARTLAWLVRTLVGGAIWWAIVIGCSIGIVRLARQKPASPAPA